MTVLREPSTRYYYTWTPALIRAAEVAAMSGNLRLAADLCEWMMGDDRVKAVLDTRTDALLGLPFEVLPAGDGRTGPRAARIIGDEWEESFPEPELKKLLAWGIMLGVGLAQIIWHEVAGMWIPRLEVWSPRWLSYDYERRSWMVEAAGPSGLSSSMPSQREPICPGDGQWIVYTPEGRSRPWVHGAYRSLARWTLLKQYAQTDWGFYSERLGQGVWVAETDPTKAGAATGTETQRKQLAADLQTLGRNSAIGLLPGQTLKLVESVARSQENFRAQIELADNGTAVSILGQNLSTQAGSGGSIGSATLHGKVAHGRTRVDGKTLPSALRGQCLVRFGEWNFADETVAPRPWWDTKPVDDEKLEADIDMERAQAAATRVNAGITTPNEERAARGLPRIEGGDVLRSAIPATSSNETPATTSVSSPDLEHAGDDPSPATDPNDEQDPDE